MRKYWIPLLVLVLVVLATVVVLRQSQVFAQTPGTVKVTPTTVTRVTLYKVNTGQRPAFDQDMLTNLIPIYEEYKKAGIITEYQIFNNATTDNANDWGVGVALTYPNFAMLDNLADRTDPITLKHYGSAAKRQAAADRRGQIRIVVSSRLLNGLRYSGTT